MAGFSSPSSAKKPQPVSPLPVQSTSSSNVGARRKLFKTVDGACSLEVTSNRTGRPRLAEKKKKLRPRLAVKRLRPRRACRYKRFNINNYVELGRPYLGPLFADILKMHLLQQRQKQVRYTFRNKWIAANIMIACSVSGYLVLKKIMTLPSPSTVTRFLRHYKIMPGISNFNASTLKVKVNPSSRTDHFCFVLLDEMSLRTGFSYDSQTDKIHGYEDDGEERTTRKVKSALCVMVVGITRRWKYPLAFFLTDTVMKSSSVCDVIERSIGALEDQGFIVKGFTTDQGSNLVRAFNLLGYTSSNPSIHLRGSSYLVFRDPPHLLKSARNFLLNGDVKVPGFDVPATWKHLIDFHRLDSARSVRLAPRISDKHLLDLKFSSKMKVKLAAQVLSNSCAAAMDLSVASNESNAACLATSTYLKKFNDLFDIFNSSSSKDKVPLRKPFCLRGLSAACEFLVEAKVWLTELLHLNSRRSHFIKGWIDNITALLQLKEDLKEELKYLSVRRLCQDPLELHFGKIRQLKRFPNAKEFSDCFSRVAVASLLRAPTTGNCEALSDRLHETEDLMTQVSRTLPLMSYDSCKFKQYLCCVYGCKTQTNNNSSNVGLSLLR